MMRRDCGCTVELRRLALAGVWRETGRGSLRRINSAIGGGVAGRLAGNLRGSGGEEVSGGGGGGWEG
jgi:hypothetical protein